MLTVGVVYAVILARCIKYQSIYACNCCEEARIALCQRQFQVSRLWSMTADLLIISFASCHVLSLGEIITSLPSVPRARLRQYGHTAFSVAAPRVYGVIFHILWAKQFKTLLKTHLFKRTFYSRTLTSFSVVARFNLRSFINYLLFQIFPVPFFIILNL